MTNSDNAREQRRVERLVENKVACVIVQDMIGHPAGAPCMEELDYMNPSKEQSAVYGAVDWLKGEGIVEEVTLPEAMHTDGVPHIFYRLTTDGWRLLRQYGLFVDEADTIADDYQRTEKSRRIQTCEEAPRP